MQIPSFDPIYSPKFPADLDWMIGSMAGQNSLTRLVDWTKDFAPQFPKATDTRLVEEAIPEGQAPPSPESRNGWKR